MSHEPTFRDGWVTPRLDELADIIQGGRLKLTGKDFVSNGYPAFGAGGINGNLEVAEFERAGIVLSANGARCGKCFLTPNRWTSLANTQLIFSSDLVSLHFLWYQLNDENRWPKSGSAQPFIRGRDVASHRVCLPPFIEQRAIVAKIEALFSELDKGVEQLEQVAEQLKRYRQAVLKAAFEGKLTAEWRAQQQAAGTLPPAEELLEQIQAERAARYAQQLADWKQAVQDWEAAGGKSSGQKKPRKPAKLKDLPPLSAKELADLPDLPEGWRWCRLEVLSDISGGLTKNSKRNALSLKLPYLRVANVYAGRLDLSEIKEIGVSEAERDKTELAGGDLLFVEGNGSADQIGRVAVWDGSICPCLHQNHLIRCRPLLASITRFLLHWFLSPEGRGFIMREASSTSGLHTLSISKVSALAVPLSPGDEQQQIISEIDQRLSILDQLQQSVEQAMKQAEALRQSILKKAFEGRLLSEAELAAVKADPAYEPAEVLLERIRAEREQAGAGTKRGRKGGKAKAARLPNVSGPERYKQAAYAAYAVQRLAGRETFGRVQQMKLVYLIPHALAQESKVYARREAAGPLDPAIHKIEGLAKRKDWFTTRKVGQRYRYTPGAKIGEAVKFAREKFGDKADRVDWLLDQFAHFDTERAELLATTFAVWNDCLIDGHEPSEDEVVAGVHGWHPEKAAKFSANRIARCIQWMKDNDFEPRGIGPKTMRLTNVEDKQ